MKLHAILTAMVVMVGVSVASAQTLQIDPVHSSMLFKVRHMDAGHVYSRFNNPTGTVTLGDNPSFNVQVNTTDVDTNNNKRDDHLRSPDFFNVKEFPTMSFKSTEVKATDDGFDVTGELTIMGQTKTINVKIARVGQITDQQGKTRAGFETSFKLNRTEFGMKPGMGVGDEVEVIFAFEAVSQ
jgi:polyisoprenoid-binding protein YceI